MTKKEIVKTISEECGLTQLKTKEIVQKTFEAIIDTLVVEGRIELRNFGVFEVKKRAARKARNPRSGDRVDVPEKFVVTFKPGKEMEERVLNYPEEPKKPQATEPQGHPASSTSPSLANQQVRPSPTPESQTPSVGTPPSPAPPTPQTPASPYPPPGGQP